MTSKHESIHGESSTNNNNGGVANFTAFINKQMEEFKDMLLSSQKQMASKLEVIQNHSESRFSKIEDELINLIPGVEKRISEVERRVEEEEISSHISVAELRKIE